MIPRTFPSTYASNGQQQMLVHFLTDVTGLQRWSDYIPVKLAQTGTEDSYANNGYIDIAVLSPLTASTQAWKEYIPVYVDDEATDTWTVNATGYIPYGYALFGDASMQLDLTNGGYLDPRITFTRASNATVTEPDGLIAYAPHNLLTYSEEFDNAVWAKTRSSISANTAVAPNGTTTADKLVENTDNNSHQITQTVTTIASTTYAFSVYLKAGERSWAVLNFFDGTTNYRTWFNLSAGTVGSNPGVNTASISNAGNGWYRCTISRAAIAASSTFVVLTSTDDGVLTYLGDGTSGIFLWGAQLNVGALQPYYTTTVKNLLGFTQEVDNAAWVKSTATVTANSSVAPDGTTTADKVIPDSTLTGRVQQTFTTTTGLTCTFSCFVKADGFGFVSLGMSAAGAYFDLSGNGAVGTTPAGYTASISSVGSGWYRCVVTLTEATGAARTFRIAPASADNTPAVGDGTSGIFLWGAQLSDSASLDPYVYNPGAAPAAAAYYGPRFDYDPVTLAPKGLLIEESRTNLLTYSEQFDNAAWNKGRSSVTANIIVSPDGTLDADKLVEDTTASNTHTIVQPSISFTSGLSYALSVYAKAAERSVLRLTLPSATFGTAVAYNFDLINGTATLVTAGTSNSSTITSVGNGWYRCTVVAQATATASSSVTLSLINGGAASYTGDGTSGLFIWGAQLEAGAFATSYIPTVASQVTRAADAASMTGTNFSSWYNQSEGTFFVSSDYSLVVGGNFRFDVTDGTSSNQMRLRSAPSGSTQSRFELTTSGVAQTTLSPATTNPALNKDAIAYKLDDAAAVVNAGTAGVDTSSTPATMNQMAIGATRLGASPINGHIRRIAYFPRRLSNTELQGITS